MPRLAIINREKCINNGGCKFICGKVCPINRTGAECIVESEVDNKPIIDETLCNGCGICTKRCPAQCISIIKLPEKLKMDPIHRFGENAFELFNLPIPKKGKVVGILGRNGIGKSTALNVLAGTIKPNLGNFKEQPTDEEIIEKYSTTMLGDYFKKLFSGNMAISYKPQRIDQIPTQYKGTVIGLLNNIDEKGIAKDLLKELEMENLVDRDISKLSGGELQKVAIIAAASRKADVYYFDEPASFLDVTTRIKVAKLIRSLCEDAAVLVVEHDLATLDYISDEIQIVYGEQSAYGIISQSKAVRRGINEYLDGFLPDDNMRFRDYSIKFFQTAAERHVSGKVLLKFPELEKNFKTFSMKTKEGEVKKAEILAVMGANGLGKSTFLKILSGQLKPDNGKVEKVKIAFKEQYPIVIKGTVKEVLMEAAKEKFTSGWYKQAILDKLGLRKLLDNEIKTLSGGELQKLHIALTLSKECEIYAFDEPSAFIDVEDRLIVAEIIKDFVIKNEVCAIVVDHDVQFIDYIGDSMLVFEGIPGKQGSVYGPVTKKEGMNKVLGMLDITYRQDRETKRPRINKPGSQLDHQQRSKGNFYYN